MPENIDKAYVKRQVKIALSTDNEDIKNDALYRAGTQMEILPCDGSANLTPEQQRTVINAADKLLLGET